MASIPVVQGDRRKVSRPSQVPSSGREEKQRDKEASLPGEAVPFTELLRRFLPARRLTSHWPESSHLAQMQVLAGGVPVVIKSVPVTKEESENTCRTGTSRCFDWLSGSDSASASLTRPSLHIMGLRIWVKNSGQIHLGINAGSPIH